MGTSRRDGDGKRVYQHEPALTDMQDRFARALVVGATPTEAARIAGYSEPGVIGGRLQRSEAVRERVRALRTNEIDKLASLSLRVLKDILRKQGVSDAVRLNAVKLSLALAGHTEKPQEGANPLDKKAISGMSLEELDAFLLAERSKRADAAKPVLDHETVQSTANPLKDNGKTEPFAGSALLIEGTMTGPAIVDLMEQAASTPGPADGDPPPGVPRP